MPSTSHEHWCQLDTFKELEAVCETGKSPEIFKSFIAWLGQLHKNGSQESVDRFSECIGTTGLAGQLSKLRQSADYAESDFSAKDFLEAVKTAVRTIGSDSSKVL